MNDLIINEEKEKKEKNKEMNNSLFVQIQSIYHFHKYKT